MSEPDSKHTARNLIARYGQRARAVAEERIAESRQQSDIAGLERWHDVKSAIEEPRRTAPSRSILG
jgi:hypothetical protein